MPAWERPQTPWWEQQRTPAWEQKQTPWWERQTPAGRDVKHIPGYTQGNVARALLERQRNQNNQNHNQGNRTQRNHGDRRPRQYPPSVVYVLPAYRYFPNSFPASGTQYVVTPPPPTQPVMATPDEPPPPPMGALLLEVEPKELLQIFVDGVYVGTPRDLGDQIELTPGSRRIELRAPGYRTLVFDAEILVDRAITYRGALEPDPARPPSTPAPSPKPPVIATGSKIMYLIPGCYMGNVSPKEVVLPPGCDISKLQTMTP